MPNTKTYEWKRFPKQHEAPGRPTNNYRRSTLAKVLIDKNAGMTYDALAVKYSVSKSTVCRMVRYARTLVKVGD